MASPYLKRPLATNGPQKSVVQATNHSTVNIPLPTEANERRRYQDEFDETSLLNRPIGTGKH